MGAAESKQEGGINGNGNEEEKRKNNSSSSSSSSMGSGTGTALAVGAAVGTALLGVAWGVSQFRSKDETDARADHQHHAYHAQSQGVGQSLISNFSRNMRLTNSNLQLESRFSISLKILSYNVCCKEEYGIQERMKAISALVERYSPHFICFQEITPEIYNTFEASSWWEDYHCSMPREKASKKQYFCILLSKFPPVATTKAPLGYSEMRRQLWVTETKVENKSLVVATSHLKSRCPGPKDPNSQYHQYKRERLRQAKQAVNILQKYPNVIFCGDMNWNEKVDGEFPLLDSWVDAWTELKGDENGYTFDTKLNGMLKGRRNIRMRLDRILCNLKGFRLEDIEIIGEEAIPDASYQRNKKQLPVLPSDHYGLLLTICPTQY